MAEVDGPTLPPQPPEPGRADGAVRTLFRHGSAYPFATALSLVSIPIGILAIYIGQDISRAFTLVYHRPEPVYVWGVVLLLGGAHVAYGIGRIVPSIERAGLYVLALAYAFYGVSVIIGLGSGGLVAGPICITLAAACLQRAHVILDQARAYVAFEGSADDNRGD